jgi:hypothetical protein
LFRPRSSAHDRAPDLIPTTSPVALRERRGSPVTHTTEVSARWIFTCGLGTFVVTVAEATRKGSSVMRTFHIRSLPILTLALVIVGVIVKAQDRSPAELNSVEVQQLVKRAEPGDSARLAAHFTALAERNTAEARRHESMAQSFVGNPNRSLGIGMSAHCKQLADLDTKSATELRALAAYHQRLASGATATAPPGSTRFERGAGAPAPTIRN